MLRHDNTPAHRSSLVSDFLEKHGTITVPQLPYSSDLAPKLFPKLKIRLKGRRFKVIEYIKKESLRNLKAYEKCITRRAYYFERDNVL